MTNIRYIAFHNGNINPDVLTYQKKVCDHFGIPIEQILTGLSHGEAIDNFVRYCDWDVLVLFDIDCIPITDEIPYFIQRKYESGELNFLIGAAQKANHIPNSQVYAGPCFMVLTKNIYEAIGKPSFVPTLRGDCAEEISYGCRERGIEINYLWPTHVEKPMWDLALGRIKFGYGTTYADLAYHAFESNANHESTENFIKKCKELIGEY